MIPEIGEAMAIAFWNPYSKKCRFHKPLVGNDFVIVDAQQGITVN